MFENEKCANFFSSTLMEEGVKIEIRRKGIHELLCFGPEK
jgi:hypothetical protein